MDRSWFYFFCYLKEGEFSYYITDYTTLSLENQIKIIFNSNRYSKETLILNKNKYSLRKVNIIFNSNTSAIVILNGDNLILFEYEPNLTPNMFRSRLLLGNKYNINDNVKLNTNENKYLNVSLENYNVSI